jgi:ATP-dependent DNA helicase RecQ
MDLEDIASARGLSMEELLDKMESIVRSGSRLNLNYYIQSHIDADVVDEIYAYFREEAESDSVDDAVAALGSDYELEEIRLVRLKFLCEVAN